jgi:hypothetical protein
LAHLPTRLLPETAGTVEMAATEAMEEMAD